MRRTIVPVDLGGSPTPCLLRPPLRPPPTPALVQALIAHYRAERAPPGADLEVAFFHGGLPTDALLEAAAGCAIRVACSPADLSRAEAERLLSAGVGTLELEVGTFQRDVLRALDRGYRPAMVLTMLTVLRARGVRLGATLVSGLPGSSHESAVADVAALVDDGGPLVDFVRLYPALALEGTGLAARAAQGAWVPMHLGEAVTTCVAMAERLDAAGIEIARVGMQPGQDVPGRVAAGPVHPNLRQLVEVRRFHRRMESAMRFVPAGSVVQISVNPRDLAWAKGTANENLRSLRAQLSLEGLTVTPDAAVARGAVLLAHVAG